MAVEGDAWVETPWRRGRRAVVLVLVVAVPVVFDTSVRPVFALPKFTVAVLGALLLVALAVGERVFGRSAPLRGNRLEVPVLLLVGWAAFTAAASADPRTSVFGNRESLNGLVTSLAFVVLFFAAADAFDGGRIRTALGALWFGAGGTVLLYAAVQLRDHVAGAPGWDPIRWMNAPDDWAAWSTLGNPNDLAGFLALLLPVGLVLLTLARPPLLRGATVVMVLLLLTAMVATGSRGALLGAVAGVGALGWWFRRCIRQRARLTLVLAGAVVGVAVPAAAVLVAEGPGPRRAGDVLAVSEGTTAQLRVELWKTAWRMAGDNPVLGVGPDRFAPSFDDYRSRRFVRVYGPDLLATDPHNVFLNSLATQGVPGLVALCFLVVAAIALFRRTTRDLGWPSALTAGTSPTEPQALAGAVGAALIAYLVQAALNRHDIALEFCWWLLLGLLCALGRRRLQPARRGRSRAATATSTPAAPTASATQEIAPSPSSSSSDSSPAETSTMSLHHS
ncbi:MAG TPA: O-antigen ligase family protein [Acidimicrobiales bacterium]|nr:O-antigen ligase family protein [Acidimicrobiales bacterium]